MSSNGTTAWRADDLRRSVDDVSVPSRRQEHSRQLDTVARYWWGRDESRWWLCTWRAQACQANGDCHASAASSRGQTSWYTSQNAGCCIHHTFQFVGDMKIQRFSADKSLYPETCTRSSNIVTVVDYPKIVMSSIEPCTVTGGDLGWPLRVILVFLNCRLPKIQIYYKYRVNNNILERSTSCVVQRFVTPKHVKVIHGHVDHYQTRLLISGKSKKVWHKVTVTIERW